MPISAALATEIAKIEAVLKQEVWLVTTGIEPYLHRMLLQHKAALPKTKIAVLIDSGGGYAESAYRTAMLLRRTCGGFTAIVPRYAKSAATLLALGADSIILGDDAELGPLDAQFADYDVEESTVSALDTVQAVEQLENSASDVALKMLRFLQQRTRKKYSVLMEPSLHFAAEITKPLFEKIDAVRYSRQSRILQEAQDYAERLLQPKFEKKQAKAIARDLVTNYPTHQFCIDREEAKRIGTVIDEDTGKSVDDPVGLHVIAPPPSLQDTFNWLALNVSTLFAIGKIVDSPPPKAQP